MSLKVIKRRWARFGQSFAAVNIKKVIFVIKLRLYERRRSSVRIWLCLWFSSFLSGEISQNFHKLWKLSCPSFQSRKKIGVIEAVFSLFAILCFLPLSKIWYYAFFSTGTRKGTNVFNVSANLRKFYWTKRDKSYSKDLYFLCRKTLRNGIELLLRSVSNHA